MKGCAAKRRAKCSWFAASGAVVELVGDPQPQLVDQAPHVERLEGEGREQLVEELGVGEVGADGVLDAGVLDLDRHLPTVAEHGPVHLADGGGRNRQAVPVPEVLERPPAELSVSTRSASSGAIGGASACSVASASCASSGRASTMKETSWPTFMATPFIWPSSWATSAAVRITNAWVRRSRAEREAVAERSRTPA